MGYYGDEKRRQMIRSILPCTSGAHSTFASKIVQRKRRNRRKSNDLLNRYSGGTASEAIDMFDDLGENFDVYVEMHHSRGDSYGGDLVQERRDNDHLAHFIRWAERLTKDMNPQDRYPFMQSILPKGFIGDHAMQHVKAAVGYNPTYDRDAWAQLYAKRRAESKARKSEFQTLIRNAIDEVARNDHKRHILNDYMLRHCVSITMEIAAVWDAPGAIRDLYPRRRLSPTGGWNMYEYFTRHQCTNVLTMNGYHEANRFFDALFARNDSRCEGPIKHRHTDWLSVFLKFFKIEIPEGMNLDWCYWTRT